MEGSFDHLLLFYRSKQCPNLILKTGILVHKNVNLHFILSTSVYWRKTNAIKNKTKIERNSYKVKEISKNYVSFLARRMRYTKFFPDKTTKKS